MCTSAAAEEGRRPYHSVVIVDISLDRLLGRTSTISGTTMATPRGDRRRRSASRFGFALRALPQRRTYTTSGGINQPNVRSHFERLNRVDEDLSLWSAI